MPRIRDTLLDRLAQWAAATGTPFDPFDPVLEREVLGPMTELLGEDLPFADPHALVEARMSEEMPDLDGTVFADLVGKVSAAMFMPGYAEIRTALARRKLTDARLLTGTDLADQRDVFMVSPTEGGFSEGVVRVFYPTPRPVEVSPLMRISVRGRAGAPARLFRPSRPVTFNLSEVRQNRSGSRYYVDVRLVAVAAGEEYDLDVGEAEGASGFPGSVFVTNLTRFRGGFAADTPATLLDRIRTAVVLRGSSLLAGVEHLLLTRGFRRHHVVLPGDDLMVRDRVYGPAAISGIPGGFTVEPAPVPAAGETPFIRLGIAYDVWVAPKSRDRVSALQVGNLRNEGVELLYGADGTLSWDQAGPSGAEYTLRTAGYRFLEEVGTPSLYGEYPGQLLPVSEGDLVVFEGVFSDAASGIHLPFSVEVVVSGNELRLNPTETLDPTGYPDYTGVPAGQYTFRGRSWKILRRATVEVGAGEYPVMAIPLTDARAYSASGDELDVDGYPALPKPGSDSPDTDGSSRVPRTANVIEDVTMLPALYAARAELADALSQAPTGDFIYPRQPLYAELLQSLAGTATDKAVLARVHLLGPVATAFPPECLVSSASGATMMHPMAWEYPDVVAVGGGADTDTIEIPAGGPTLTDPLTHGATSVPGRTPSVGDWALFTDGTSGTLYALPIVAFVDGDKVQVAAPDIPSGAEGTLQIVQGASRASLLSDGRGPEGTYSVDVWLRESDAAGYTPGDPPVYGTKAMVDMERLLSQGFDLVSALPGQQGSAQERVTLLMHGARANDGEQLGGRSVYVHADDAADVAAVQRMLTDDRTRALCLSGMAKLYTPTYVVFSVYFTSTDLSAEEAADAVFSAFDVADGEGRLEVSDLIAAVREAGADYTVNGRAFALTMDHLRRWSYVATKGAIPLPDTGRFVLHSVTATRLYSPEEGEIVDDTDPDNVRETYTRRWGGFDAD